MPAAADTSAGDNWPTAGTTSVMLRLASVARPSISEVMIRLFAGPSAATMSLFSTALLLMASLMAWFICKSVVRKFVLGTVTVLVMPLKSTVSLAADKL